MGPCKPDIVKLGRSPAREIGLNEGESSVEVEEKLVTLMRPTLDTADSSVSGNMRKRRKANALLCPAPGSTSTVTAGIRYARNRLNQRDRSQ